MHEKRQMLADEGPDLVDGAIDILQYVYRRSVFQGFRRPVVSMYPSLKSSYIAVVKSPMDLGTLLLLLLIIKNGNVHDYQAMFKVELAQRYPDFVREVESCGKSDFKILEWFREKLSLVSTNSLNFNKGSHMIEGMSAHLYNVSQSLFQDTFQMPFSTDGLMVTLKEVQIKRLRRFHFIQNIALSFDELHYFRGITSRALSRNDLHVFVRRQLEVIDAFDTKNDAIPLSRLLNLSLDPSFIDEECVGAVSTATLALLEIVSPLLVLVEERVLRGISFSNIWAR